MSWKKRTANQPIFRIPGVELFEEKHDEDMSIQALRQAFGELMIHRLGTRTPEPIDAVSEYADWTEEIRTELVRRVPEVLARLRRGVEDETGFSCLGDRFFENSSLTPQEFFNIFLYMDKTSYEFEKSAGGATIPIEFSGEDGVSYTPGAVTVSRNETLAHGRRFDWDTKRIADRLCVDTLIHEMLHVCSTTELRGSGKHKVKSFGLWLSEGEGALSESYIGKWANEALIEHLLQKIYPLRELAYIRQNFVLTAIEEKFPGTISGLADVAFGYVPNADQIVRVKFALFSLQEKLNTIMVPYLGVHSEDFARSLVAQLDPEAAGVDTELWNSLQVVFDAMSIRDDDIEALRVADDIVYKCISEELFERAKSSYEKQDLAYVFDNIAPRVKERKSKLTKRIAFGAAAVVLGYGPITRYASEPVCTEALDVVTEPVETVTPGSANVDGQNVGIGVPFTLPNGRVVKITEVEPTVPSFERLDCR